MEAAIDAGGRILVPKAMREAMGLVPGSVVDISFYGAGIAILPTGPTATLAREGGRLVFDSETEVTDDTMFALIESGRR